MCQQKLKQFLIHLSACAVLVAAASCSSDARRSVLVLQVSTSPEWAEASQLKITLGADDVRQVSLDGVDLTKSQIVVGVEDISATEPDGTVRLTVDVEGRDGCVLARVEPFYLAYKQGEIEATVAPVATTPGCGAIAPRDGAAPDAMNDMDAADADDSGAGPGKCGPREFERPQPQETQCLPWTDCPAGTLVAEEGTEVLDRVCRACMSGTYSAQANAPACSAWTVCPVGSFIETAGTTMADQKCASCPAGKYTAQENSSACVDNGTCAPGTEQVAAGSGSQAPNCAPCAAGTYCAGGTTPKAICAGSNWDHDGSSNSSCVPKTTCSPGQYVTGEGTATTDRTCASCPQGEYTSQPNQTACMAGTKQVPCDVNNNNPANSSDIVADVAVTYSNGTWSQPAACQWACVSGYAKEGAACFNSKQVPCNTDNGSPPNSADVVVEVPITFANGAWSAPAACQWSCASGYVKEGNACINSKQEPCDTNNGNPANSTDVVVSGTVSWSPSGGWQAPPKCAWNCNANYALEGGLCINSKQAACTKGANPPNSTDSNEQVTITYSSAAGWSTPASCSWVCNTPYKKSGNACVPAIYVFSVRGTAGALGSRASVDSKCQTAAAAYSFPRSQVAAFISFSASDEIRDLPATKNVPTNRYIVGWRKLNTSGEVIADDWADLLDGTIQRSFVQAGIMNDQDSTNFNNWFSGSNTDGSLALQTCNGWQPSADGTNAGTYGGPYNSDGRWISAHGSGLCGGGYDLLCIGYTP